MDRRNTIKSILLGSLAGGLTIAGCKTDEVKDLGKIAENDIDNMGWRTERERKAEEKLRNEEDFFTHDEIATLAVLCDLILPADGEFGSAVDAGVPEFISFIAKDMKYLQTPLRGGLMWINNRSNKLFGLEFNSCSESQKKEILDSIAYPKSAIPEVEQGAKFFSTLRNLTLTGYFTSKIGIKALGYQGNTPNVWDGVPQEVLDDYGISYESEWLAKCINQDTRNKVATWDDEGNLIS